MYISINWIKDFVDLDGIDIENLIYKFTMSTAEVEDIIKKGEDINGVIVGKIIHVEDIENSKKLHKLLVDTGEEKVQVVCGAPNVKVGIKVPFAPVGSKVGGMEIGKATLANTESFGMCLSEKELGISDDHSGLVILSEDTKVGEDIKNIIPIDDIIYEVDNKSLTNRPDLWGHYGIAREIATITGRKLRPLEIEDLSEYNELEKLSIGVEAEDDNVSCLRYSALKIENVNKKKSSWKIKTRLYYCGLRSINLLADMTNYIMLELGQPLHAFDGKLINSINVKKLKADEQFITLDGNKRELKAGTLMICNENTPVAIAGIMGGINSDIKEETDSVFLESANFDAVLIRKTASALDLRTDAAAHYEKTLDPELTKLAIERFVKVLKEEDKGIEVTSSFSDVYIKKYPDITIAIDKDYIDRIIGKVLSMDEIVNTLTSLEFGVQVDGKNLIIKVPSFRATKDVSQKADIIEEIARIYGYDNIEPKTNLGKILPIPRNEEVNLEYEIKKLLATKYGMSEIHSYVWYNKELNKELNIEVEDNIKITNAIVKLDNTLRREMAPTMLYAINSNMKYYDSCKIFEVGRVFDYKFDNQNVKEEKVLGICLASLKQTEKELVFEAKSMIDNIVNLNKNLKVQYVNMEKTSKNYMHPVNTFEIIINDIKLGYISVVNPKVSDKINKKCAILVAEINVTLLNELEKLKTEYKAVSKYQSVDFDLSIIVEKQVKYADIEEVIKNADMNYLVKYDLVDIYLDESKLKDKKAVTIRFTLNSMSDTLTKEQIDSDRDILLQELNKNNMYINM